MLMQFGATAESLSKASTLVSRIGTDAHLYDDPEDVSIGPLLDSKFDSEKHEALKRLLALIAQGFDVSSYFPQVVKNVASQSVEVKKLVYLYLLHYAEKRPNETLLSINCFQKDLGDPNPLVRAWALRTMAGIRLHAIAPLVLVVVGKCARDPSVYVRKCAAIALPKLHDLQVEEHTATIEEIVGILLNDNSPAVVGAAAVAFTSVCPHNLTLIGKHYRKLCEILTDVEEWGQIALIGVLLRYAIAKHGLVRESIMLFSKSYNSENEEPVTDIGKPPHDDAKSGIVAEVAHIVCRSYLEGSDKYLSHLGLGNSDYFMVDKSCVTSSKSNDDIKALLRSTLPLLWSCNSAVVLAAAGVHWIMAPVEDIVKIVKPLLFLLRSSSYSKYVVLCNIQVLVKAMPSLFSLYFEDFFISSSDSYQIKSLKLEILSAVATYSSIFSILQEFQDYIRDPDRRFAADVVTAIGLCVQRLPDVADNCLEGLLFLALSEYPNLDSSSSVAEEIVLVQIIKSIEAIIKQDPSKHERIIACLVRRLELICAAEARAVVIWMIGEYCNIGNILPKMVPVVLKYLARCFPLEAVETKLQILISCIKVLLRCEGESISELKILVGYVLELALSDMSYDVRDRARVMKKLHSKCMQSHHQDDMNGQSDLNDTNNLLTGCIFRRERQYPSPPITYRVYLPGSLSQIVFHAAPGYLPLPEPCSLVENEISLPVNGVEAARLAAIQTHPDVEDNSYDSSGSVDQEDESEYSSQNTGIDSEGSSVADDNNGELIHLSDVASGSRNQLESTDNINPQLAEYDGVMSNRALELWLNENPSSSQNSADSAQFARPLARFSIKNLGLLVKPIKYTLLDRGNNNILGVDYIFSSEVSTISKQLVCLELFFSNFSAEPISDIYFSEDLSNQAPDSLDSSKLPTESDVEPTLHMDKIDEIAPGQTTSRLLQVRFEHHLLPLKLMLWYNGNKQPVKLRPNIGYFVKPLCMDSEAFANQVSKLTGMFECTRSVSFKEHITQPGDKDKDSQMKDDFLLICEKLAVKMLSNANLFLVSVDMPIAANLNDLTGLCLRFSGEILSSSIPCLVTLAVKGTFPEPLEVSVRMNCEETVFALNLLNKIVNLLAES